MNIMLGDVRCNPGGATVTSGSLTTTILGPFNLLNYKDKSFTLYNYGSVTLSGAVIQVNPDHQGAEYAFVPSSTIGASSGPNSGLWENFDTTSFQSLASGAIKSVQVSAATGATLKWWRVQGTADHSTGAVTISGWMYARSI